MPHRHGLGVIRANVVTRHQSNQLPSSEDHNLRERGEYGQEFRASQSAGIYYKKSLGLSVGDAIGTGCLTYEPFSVGICPVPKESTLRLEATGWRV
jgi:hypothetical protein